eukprot:TRINITY_DN5609_c0_g1_i2.p1 TRINITY_DN5609_c0_g1~~TRINITY_DN5609_c0_g1_i2.p1  ORF type:complete len:621 (-),score=80.75 TRINITY_DN5609_c0_g1_i2:7-1839(-)
MICLLLGTDSENPLKEDFSERYPHLEGVPTALLPLRNGKTILGNWWEIIQLVSEISDFYLIVDANKFKHFERWATANHFPVAHIINDGTTTAESRPGSLLNVMSAIDMKGITSDIVVIELDTFFLAGVDLAGVVHSFKQSKGNIAVYSDVGIKPQYGSIEIDPVSNIIATFCADKTPTPKHVGCGISCFKSNCFAQIQSFVEGSSPPIDIGMFMARHVGHAQVFGYKLTQTGFPVNSFLDYEHIQHLPCKVPTFASKHRAYARVGVLGNPSDGVVPGVISTGFYGKTIAMCIGNFWAEASIKSSDQLILQPHPLNDPNTFGSLRDLHTISTQEGYMGGLRLLQATCKRFFELCAERHISLPQRNFTLSYDTNIPRQVGLAGSSCIITAVTRSLIGFYGITPLQFPKEHLPNFILSIESEELFITAGLQDRVAQVYEAPVFMDFDQAFMKEHGHGRYEELPLDSLPPFWLAYAVNPSDSGRIHSTVRERWRNGDHEVIEGMKELASFAQQGKEALLRGDHATVAELMDKNFSIRRKLFGEPCLGKLNLRMIDIAHQFGSAAKFPGSGGAVLGLCTDKEKVPALRSAMEKEGFVFVEIRPLRPDQRDKFYGS